MYMMTNTKEESEYVTVHKYAPLYKWLNRTLSVVNGKVNKTRKIYYFFWICSKIVYYYIPYRTNIGSTPYQRLT